AWVVKSGHSQAFSAYESAPQSLSFPDTEFPKNHIQPLLHIEPAGEPPGPREGMAQVLGQELVSLSRATDRLAKRSGNLPQLFPLSLARDERRFGSAEGGPCKANQGSDEL